MAQGTLFTLDFLTRGVAETAAWRDLGQDAVSAATKRLRAIFDGFPTDGQPNEATTEARLIFEVLRALGWEHFLPQQAVRVEDIPDILLFVDKESFDSANARPAGDARYRFGTAIVESKRWQLALDRRTDRGDRTDRVPSSQILRYLTRMDAVSDRAIQWGVLTNGRHWRLYYQRAKSRPEDFLEIDLPLILGVPGLETDLFSPPPVEFEHWLKVFILMFRREAFARVQDRDRTFHELALEEGRLWEDAVTRDLSDTVFGTVFPGFVQAIADADPTPAEVRDDAYLSEVRDGALTLLYRLLFVLYAEDRDLLPVRDGRYDDYGLRRHVRAEIQRRIDAGDALSSRMSNYYDRVANLFDAIAEGEPSIGLPPYNGGLFDPARAPILKRARLSDSAFAPLFDRLARRYGADETADKKYINYRDLSVQELGSIYERLLEFEPRYDESGKIGIQPNVFARKGSGSYYTPQDLVDLIIQRTVGPLVDERIEAFRAKAEELRGDRRPVEQRLADLRRLDPAEAILDLKICDPAMGSGHFLVSLVDYLADRILESSEIARELVGWAKTDAPYQSPLLDRMESIRERIAEQARENGWRFEESQLEDRLIVRRMILKKAVYGVDKNPMAVELAKLSLWLHTFTVGAPLSFLDHHLRCGDSLFGEWVRPVEEELTRAAGFFINSYIAQARNAARGMAQVEEITDADIAEVAQSREKFDAVRGDTGPLDSFLAFWHALRWLAPLDALQRRAVDALLDGSFGDPVRIVSGAEVLEPAEVPPDAPLIAAGNGTINGTSAAEVRNALIALLGEAQALIAEQRFFNWEAAFPGIWCDWHSAAPSGGFDAVIGNPPWDRIKLQEVEWFAARRPEIAYQQRAADRRRRVEALKESGDPLAAEYDIAVSRAEAASRVARGNGQYPALARGDINIYALFVERGQRLIKADGMAGLLVPSGIASDQGTSAFFREMATNGRVGTLFDFENRGIFFPDVHRSFKFCCFVTGGPQRRFDETRCAFILHDVAELSDPDRSFALTAAQFAIVNPNTGTAPIFRSKRDAAITTRIYERFPVLVNRSGPEPMSVWPVRYFTMFHMTNDAHLFHTRAALEAAGAYPVAGNRWKKGDEEYVPLYVGRMVHQFDHRAASVSVNEANLHNPALSDSIGSEEHADPNFVIRPQYWVSADDVHWPGDLSWAIGFRDIARTTDERTAIAAIVPRAGVGNTLPLLQCCSDSEKNYVAWAPQHLANLNAVILDFVCRQKVQSTHLNWYIVEQLPVVPDAAYDRRFGPKSARDIVADHVLRLTYTAWDMQPFARDMGYDGDPFIWDEEERRHLRARLDALYFLLYGVTDRDDVAYILDTFPIVRRQDEQAFGRYRTKDLILAYMNALEAGDSDSVVDL